MRYIVLGSSAAGISGVRELRRLDSNAEIILISEDRDIYSRCILHHYLGGRRSKEQLSFVEENFQELYQINWKKGETCTGIDRAAREVILKGGERLSYDKLLIATGAGSFVPPIKGLEEAKNVKGFRCLEDIEQIKKAAEGLEHIVVMGAGLVGLDCVTGLAELGKAPVIVDMEEWPLSRQLDERAAGAYRDALLLHGVKQYYKTRIQEAVLGEDQMIRSLILSDQSEIPCDYLIVTAGVRANVAFLKDSGIETSWMGLVYDETGRTNDEYIYGAGDVSGLRPIWPVAVKEGIVAAGNMAGAGGRMTDFFASKSTMNFFGIPTMSLGQVTAGEGEQTEIDEKGGCYKKIIHKNGKIKGAILQGDLAYSGILQQLIARKIDISRIKKPVFEIDYSDFFHVTEQFEYYYDEDEKGE